MLMCFSLNLLEISMKTFLPFILMLYCLGHSFFRWNQKKPRRAESIVFAGCAVVMFIVLWTL